MRYGLVCIALLFAACSLKADYTGTLYACDPNGACPDQFVCIEDRCVPTEPQAGTCVTAMTSGEDHTCAVRKDGTVWCWGRNDFGQLGSGLSGMSGDQTRPVQVTGLTHMKAVAGGNNHSCAIDTKGSAWCWGNNQSGQLGNGAMADSATPAVVTGVTGATAIVTGDSHSCALLGDGTVTCWGANDAGQLGDESTTQHNLPLPVHLPPGTMVTAVSAGGATTCAVDSTHALWCWGNNSAGEFGDGSKNSSGKPVHVPLANASGVAVGREFSCALADGAVWCSGVNDQGQLGNFFPLPLMRAQVELPTPAVTVVAGDRFACTTDDQGHGWCWGENFDFQLANITNDNQVVPTLASYPDVQSIVGGGNQTCSLSKAGGLTCSGYNGHGQLGDGRRTTQGTPHPVTGLTGVTAIAAGNSFTCATLADKTAMCWGQNGLGELGDGSFTGRTKPVPVQGVQGLAQLAVGGEHACALLGDASQSVVCWGGNFRGQLGDNTADSHGVARPVIEQDGSKLTGVTQIAAGGDHTCAMLTGGAVRCWGFGEGGQNGDGTTNESHVPSTPVALMMPAVQIAVGDGHACAIAMDRTVWCWGDNHGGQLGNGTGGMTPFSTSPVQATGLKNIQEITAHGGFTCARANDGTISCWGFGGNGEIGIGQYFGSDTPAKINGGADATKVVSGGGHSCAITTGGTIKCWGASYLGQIGDDGYSARLEPVQIPGLTNVIGLAAGDQHTCALLQDATISCWGDDRDGELGDGISREPAPVAPLLPCP